MRRAATAASWPGSAAATSLDTATSHTPLASLALLPSQFFSEVNNAAENDKTGVIPDDVREGLAEMGAYGMQVPEQYGGLGLSNTQYARLTEVVGAHDLGVGVHLGAHQSIGFKGILLEGNDEQKAKYLPKLASGEHIAAFALTEPSTGSDASSVRTRATLSDDGKHFLLNGNKLWISNGGFADVFTVFAQTEVTDEKTGEKKDKMTAFIVERAFGGVSAGPPEDKMGIKCSNTVAVHFDNTPIPMENVLGEVGGGFKVAMAILNNGRFGLGAAMTGVMKACMKGAAEHAAERVQFGRKIKDFELIQSKLATMAADTYAVESMAYLVAGNMDRGASDYHLEAAVSKIFGTEAAWRTCDETIQVLGGLGFMREYPYERMLRDLRIKRIFEGTNDILRLFVALTGMKSAGDELKKVTKAPAANLSTVVNMALAKFGLPVPAMSVPWAAPGLEPAAAVLGKYTAAFGAATSNYLAKYGKGIIERQMELERVANIVIDLSVLAACLSRASSAVKSGSPTAAHEVELVNVWAGDAATRLQNNLEGMTGEKAEVDAGKKAIAGKVFEELGYVPGHPLGV